MRGSSALALASACVASVVLGAAPPLSSVQRKAVDALVANTMRSAHIAGATIAVSANGAIAYERAYGLADPLARTAATGDTVYPIGSITKQFTAACILMLAHDGRLAIDDPLSRFVPELPWADRVTLRHLLDQESGIVDFRLGIDPTTPASRSEIVDHLKQTDLYFAPGSRYEYSNSNYYLLGMVVERASGESYARFLRDRILVPQGLDATYYDDGSTPIPARAHGSIANPDGPHPAAPENAGWSAAAGAIASTAADLIRWDERLRAGKVLDESSTALMFTPGVLDDGTLTDYAFGWVVVKHDGHREIWHNGEITGFHAMNVMYPDDDTDIVVLTNTGGTFEGDSLAVRIFDLLHPFRPAPADTAAAGRASEWFGRVMHADIDRTQLTPELSALLSDAVVQSLQAQLRPYGKLRRTDVVASDEDASGRSYDFTMVFASQKLRCRMGIDRSGKISALSYVPM